MKKINKYFTCILFFFSHLSKGQNLVPNPSFEEFINQPCNFISYGASIGDYVNDWKTPTGGTSDIWFYDSTNYKLCRQNLFLYGEKARSGKFCAGLFMSNINVIGSRKPYREYIQVHLNKPLIPGNIYYVEMYVQLEDKSSFATNNFGILFSEIPVTRLESRDNFGDLLNYTPQINGSQIVSAQKQWKKVSGCFKATSAFRYLTIGNFFDDSRTLFKPIPEKENNQTGSYYLIDDVLVQESGINYLPSSGFLGSDTTLCENQFYTLTLPDSVGITYSGFAIQNKYQYHIYEPGIYSVTATAGNCIVVDTLLVSQEKNIRLPTDTILCKGETLLLKPLANTRQFVWSDNSKDSTLKVTQGGIYWITAYSPYCTNSDTIKVDLLDCPGVVPNVFTPNDDGFNDFFYIEHIELLPWKLQVYNRWGACIYESSRYHNEWNGNGMPVGTYYYSLTCQLLNRQLKGWVQVLR